MFFEGPGEDINKIKIDQHALNSKISQEIVHGPVEGIRRVAEAFWHEYGLN